MATDQLPALLPCPFCGHSENIKVVNTEPDDLSGGHFIECPKCHASTGIRFACGEDPRPLLAEQWNRRAAIAADRARAVPVAWREAFEAAMRDAWECADPLHPPGQPGSYARGSWQGMQDGLATLRNNFDLRLREAASPPAPEQPADLSGQAATAAGERTPVDYALEHAEYMAAAAERFVTACDREAEARQAIDDNYDEGRDAALADALDEALEHSSESRSSLRTRVYEFRKRRDRASLSTPASGEGWMPAKQAPESPEMGEGWSVTVSRHGVMELTISDEHYCGGRELDEGLIVGAAQHLLAFVGYGLPPCSFDPDDAPTSPTEPAASSHANPSVATAGPGDQSHANPASAEPAAEGGAA